jgi:hypothetical protein
MPVEKWSELGDVAGSNGQHQVLVGFNHSVCRNYSFLKRLHESEPEQSKIAPAPVIYTSAPDCTRQKRCR